MTEPSFEHRRLSFGAEARRYADLRPGYPRFAVVWALTGARGPVRRVADVGAGTGALTSALLDLDLDVDACDPDPGMLAELSRRHPQVRAHAASAEGLPFADASLDAVLAGQAWHWFDQPAAAEEFARVLRPGGVLALLWNVRDDRQPWMAALSDLIDGADSVRSSRTDARNEIDEVHPGTQWADVPHRVPMTPEQVVALVSTFSYIRLREDAEEIYSAVRDLVATHPDTRGRSVVPFPYVTATYRWVRD